MVPPLQWLDISYNRVGYLMYVEAIQQLYYLNMSHQTSKKCYSHQLLPESLIFFDLSGTQGCLPWYSCFLLIEFVDFSNTGLEVFFNFDDVCQSVYNVAIRHLDLQNNEFQCINSRIFTEYDWSALSVLKLSNNQLGFGKIACSGVKVAHFLDFLKPLGTSQNCTLIKI